MESSTCRTCSDSMIGVMPTCLLSFGPFTNIAGLSGTTCLMTSQLKSPRSAARCCLTEGAVRNCEFISIYAETCNGRMVERCRPLSRHQPQNCATAVTYAARVLVTDRGGEEFEEM